MDVPYYDDTPPGVPPKRKLTLALVEDDDDDDDTLLPLPVSKRPADRVKKQSARETSPAKPAPTPERGSERGKKAAAPLDAQPNSEQLAEEEEADPAYLAHKRELERLKNALRATARETEIVYADDTARDVISLDDDEPAAAAPTKPPSPPPAPPLTAMRQILLRLRISGDKGQPKTVKYNYERNFEKLIKRLADQHKCDPNAVKLEFDGDPIDPSQTPADLELEEDDLIDCVLKLS
jgi:hypothetical protein